MGLLELFGYVVTGLVAGLLGGLLGIGGGVVMVPAVNLIFDEPIDLAIAASLSCMVFLSASAAYGHWRNGFVLKPVAAELIPTAAVFAVVGVLSRGWIPTWVMYFFFALFMVYTAYNNIGKILSGRKAREEVEHFRPPNKWIVPLVAAPMGFACGLLGIGGGVIAVPALNIIVGLPFKNAVACSSATIVFSSLVAAVAKIISLSAASVDVNGSMTAIAVGDALIVAACMTPTALVFGRVGAHLTKIAPTKVVRVVFAVLVIWAGYKYAVKSHTSFGKWRNPPAAVTEEPHAARCPPLKTALHPRPPWARPASHGAGTAGGLT